MIMKDYTFMDDWNDEEVVKFKEEGIEQQEAFGDKALYETFKFDERPQLVAKGDSWFDYLPGTDLIDCLRKHHGYSIKNYSEAGDTLENMVYGTKYKRGSFETTEPTISKVLRKIEQLKPKIFLFSGGGNDIAGDEFGSYLNHSYTYLNPLRHEYIEYMINSVFRKCCMDLIKKVSDTSQGTHIVMHGYGHTFPNGEGVSFFGFSFAGPWLRPALTAKRILDESEQMQAVEVMIDTYNEMLKKLDEDNPKFHYVDLRSIIDPYKDWTNELHLKNSAYARAADKINDVILQIG